jgi:EmrB/QacA subfamily drug resistance transporter
MEGGSTQPRPVATAAPDYTHAEKMRVISGILLCIFLSAIDQTMVLPAIPQMASNLRGGGSLSWVVSSYLLTSTATTPIYGKLSDQLGRRPVLMPAIILFVLASVLCALSDSVVMLTIARALQGIGGGGLVAVTQAAIADVLSPRERGKYQGWFAGTWGIASIAGPTLGGFVVQSLSWQWIFWLNIPLGLIAFVLCMRGLKGLTPVGKRSKIDYLGAALLTASVGAVLFGLSEGGVVARWTSPVVLIAFTLGALMLAALIAQQKYVSEPLFPGDLMVMPGYRSIIAISFFVTAGMFGGIFLLPLFLQWIFHASPVVSGVEIIPFMAVNALGAYTAGQICRKTGRTRTLLVSGLAISALGFFILGLAPAHASVWVAVIASGISGLGIGFVMPTSLVIAQNQSPRKHVGLATSILLLLRAMGGAFGATMVGALLSLGHGVTLIDGFRAAFIACALLASIATAIALRMQDTTLRNTLDISPPTIAEKRCATIVECH